MSWPAQRFSPLAGTPPVPPGREALHLYPAALSGHVDPKVEWVLELGLTQLPMDVALLSEFSAGNRSRNPREVRRIWGNSSTALSNLLRRGNPGRGSAHSLVVQSPVKTDS